MLYNFKITLNFTLDKLKKSFHFAHKNKLIAGICRPTAFVHLIFLL